MQEIYKRLSTISSNNSNTKYEELIKFLNEQYNMCATTNYDSHSLREALEEWGKNNNEDCSFSHAFIIEPLFENIINTVDLHFLKTTKDISIDEVIKVSQENLKLQDMLMQFEIHYDIKGYSEETLIHGVHSILNMLATETKIDESAISMALVLLMMGGNLCQKINNLDYFAHSMGLVFISSLYQKNHTQKARNIAETLYLYFKRHSRLDLAFLMLAHVYSFQRASHFTSIYMSLSIVYSIRINKTTDKYIHEIKIMFLKLLRDIEAYEMMMTFNDVHISIINDEQTRFSANTVLATTFLSEDLDKVESITKKTLSSFKDRFRNEGTTAIYPWLIIIFQLIKRNPTCENTFTKDLTYFKDIIGVHVYDNIHAHVFPSIESFQILKDALSQMSEVLYTHDIGFDNKNLSVIAKQGFDLIDSIKDIDNIYLCLFFLLSPEFTRDVNNDDASRIESKEKEESSTKLINIFRNKCIEFSKLLNGSVCILASSSSSSNYGLTINEKGVENLLKLNWTDKETYNWVNLNKELLNVKETSEDDFFSYAGHSNLQENCKLKIDQKITNFVINYDFSSKPLILLRSFDNSYFPHNFYKNIKNKFISLEGPISLSFSIEKDFCKTMSIKNNIAIWAPCDSGDMTINMLFSRLSRFNKDNKINVTELTNGVPSEKLKKDIAFLITHGGSDIDKTQQVYFMNGDRKIQLNQILDGNKFIVLFVCHAGKQSKSRISYDVNSLVSNLLKNGAIGVIAPSWPLHIDIAYFYYKKFMAKLNDTLTLGEIHHQIMLEMSEQNINPAVWGNLHYYGNPNLTIK
ncbi:MAG: hypothetical protein COA39_007920 [Sulfurimonas sp.]|nr:hypothetical protein [Sulfurimonas sp.]